MNVLASLLLITVIVTVAGVLGRRLSSQPTVPVTYSVENLIDDVLLGIKSLNSEMPDLKESFRASAYLGCGGAIAWSPETCVRLTERLEHVKLCLRRMDINVLKFDRLGSLCWNYSMGEDPLALNIVTKAAGCKTTLIHLQRRIRIYDWVPVSTWPLLGRKFADSVLFNGNDLIQQYQILVERVLVFIKAHGETYQYENLLSAM